MNDRDEYKDHALSRVYREGSWPEPSRQIDEAILAASRRAARERHPFVWRWAPPFALAATVVLASAVVLRTVQEKPEVISESATATGATQPAAERPKAGADRSKNVESKPAAPAVEAQAPRPVTAPPGFALQMDTAEAERLNQLQRELGLKQSPPASESPLKPGDERFQATVRARAAEASPAPPPRAAFAERPPAALKKETPPATRADQSQPAAAPPQSVPQNALMLPREPQPQSPPQAAPEASRQAPSGVVRPEPLSARRAPETPPVASSIGASAPIRPAQIWIEDIRKLKAEGKAEEAARQLAEFKGLYPDYALPEDLR